MIPSVLFPTMKGAPRIDEVPTGRCVLAWPDAPREIEKRADGWIIEGPPQ